MLGIKNPFRQSFSVKACVWMADETIAVLGVLVALFLVLDVFLYYRWKGSKEDAEEKHRSKRIAHVKEYVSKFAEGHGEADEGGATSEGGVRGHAKTKPRSPAFEQALDSMGDLRKLAGRDLGFLRDRLDSTHRSLSGEPKEITLTPSAEGEGDSAALEPSGGVKVFFQG